MARKKWHTHCTLMDVSVDFGLRCYGCKYRELPKDPTRDMRLCIHEKYVEENETPLTQKIMTLFKDKTRWQHFGIGFVLGLLFTIITVLAAAAAAEYKDRAHGGKWDWADLVCTLLGGLAGQALQAAIVCAIIFS